jgi:hypothetical protein
VVLPHCSDEALPAFRSYAVARKRDKERNPGPEEGVRELGIRNLVPKGRLNLAQDVSPGYIMNPD